MNSYVAFYKDRRVEVKATTSYGAQVEAQKVLKVKESQRHNITVVLAMKDDQQVTHLPLD